MIRILIVDDSPTMRQLVRAILESDPVLRVVGEAEDGVTAISLCEKLQPDLITMDIRMPRMNGFQAIRHIMSESPRPIVVLTSPESDRELKITFKAIEAGALMVLGKPDGLPGNDSEAAQFIAQVKAMAGVKVVRRRWGPTIERPVPSPSRAQTTSPRDRGQIIAIGASTGGPPAIQAILKHLPSDLPAPVIVVQHISIGFMVSFVKWLDQTTPWTVKLAQNGELLRPGVVYLAPDDHHLLIGRYNLCLLSKSPPVDGHRPSVTALFESAAQNHGPAAIGVLLTGMGADGARGLRSLHKAGGRTIVQDESTCVVFGMPGEAVALGAVDEILPLGRIGSRLGELLKWRMTMLNNQCQ